MPGTLPVDLSGALDQADSPLGMLFWLLMGWVAAAVVLAWLHHRMRRVEPSLPSQVEEFLVSFEAELAAFPEVEYLGLLPGQFTGLLRVGGQETPVPLQGLYRQVQAYSDRLGVLVQQLIEEIKEVGLDHLEDHQFGSVATAILPQVRSRAWLTEQGLFGDGALVHRPLCEELMVVYVIDDEHTMVFVCRAHLKQWGRTSEDLHSLSISNLARLGGSEQLKQMAQAESVLVQTGDGYDAARVLLLEDFDGMLVALPDRDTLWIGQDPAIEPDAKRPARRLMALSAAAETMARSAPHPVSEQVFRVRGGTLEPIND